MCPKNYICAAIVLLDNYIKQEKIVVNNAELEERIAEMYNELKRYVDNSKRYLYKREKDIIPFSTNLFSKSLFYSVGFKEERTETVNVDKYTKHDKIYQVKVAKNFDEGRDISFEDIDGIRLQSSLDNNEIINLQFGSLDLFEIKRIFGKLSKAIDFYLQNHENAFDYRDKLLNLLQKNIIESVINAIENSTALPDWLLKDGSVESDIVIASERFKSYYIDIHRFKDTIVNSVFANIEDMELRLELQENIDVIIEYFKREVDKYVIGYIYDSFLRNTLKNNENIVEHILKMENLKPFVDVKSDEEDYNRIAESIEQAVKSKTGTAALELDCVFTKGSVQLPARYLKKSSGEIFAISDILRVSTKEVEFVNKNIVLEEKEIKTPIYVTLSYEKPSMLYIRDKDKANNGRYLRHNKYNEGMNKKSFVRDTFLEKFDTFIIDEADKSLAGSLSMALRTVAKSASHIVTASGTPIGGYAREMAYQNAYSGLMNSRAIEYNKMQYVNQCGMFKINSKFLSILYSSLKKDVVAETFYEAYMDFLDMQKNDKSNSIITECERYISNILTTIANEELEDVRKLEDISISKEANVLASFFKDIRIYAKNNSINIGNSGDLVNTVEMIFTSSDCKFVKEYPGINNAKTFVGLVKSSGNPNASIMSREILKKREEKLTILDIGYAKNLVANKALPTMSDFVENNYVGIRVLQEGMKSYCLEKFIDEIYWYSINNFDALMSALQHKDNVKESAKIVSETLGKEFTSKDFLNISSNSSSSASDNFKAIYKEYLEMDRKYPSNKRLDLLAQKYGDERISVFRIVLKMYDIFMDILHKRQGDMPTYFKFHIGDIVAKIKGVKNYYKKDFIRYDKETLSTSSVAFENGLPKQNDEILPISQTFDFCKKEWKEFLKPRSDGNYIPYKMRFNNYEEQKILDVLGSKGILRNVGNSLAAGKSFSLSSTRSGSNIFNFLNLISIAAKREDKSKVLNIIVNTDMSAFGDINIKDIIARIDERFLMKNNIKLSPTKRTTLDSEVKSSYRKGEQIVVVSNYESISRGLDLSMLDEIHATGAMEKGKELVQYLARLYSVDKDEAKIYMFHGGKDMSFIPTSYTDMANLFEHIIENEADEIIENMDDEKYHSIIDEESRTIIPTYTMVENMKGYQKLMTVKYFMSGRKSSEGEKIELEKIVEKTEAAGNKRSKKRTLERKM